MLSFASLGSGSKGNGTLVEAGDTRILLDCGFGLAETKRRLARLECDPDSLAAILLTHEHGDHSGGVGKLSRKYNLPVYLTVGTHHACKDNRFHSTHFIDPHSSFKISELEVQPFPVPHDAREPCQYVFGNGSRKLGVLTDVGCITPCIIEHLNGVDALLLECNYDYELLITGPYPQTLKNRVSGSYGHLDNQQSRHILEKINTEKLQYLIGMHVSEKNNHNDHVMDILKGAESAQAIDISIACQENGFFWKKIL